MNKNKPTNDSGQHGTTKRRSSLSLDLRWVVAVLLMIIAGILLWWQPWTDATSDRTISVTGQATVSAEPDEYVFNPSYSFENDDRQAALDQLTDRSEQLVAELKKLGVDDSQIKTNTDSYDFGYRGSAEPGSNSSSSPDSDLDQSNYTLRLTVTVADKDQAQEVQDYLLTTEPSGSISPYATFSDQKRTQLEAKARDQATKDARKKAEQSADNLGFKVGGVKTISDGTNFGVFPLDSQAEPDIAAVAPESNQLSLQPGQNDITYSVTVVFYVR